jgi:hypothetical protein
MLALMLSSLEIQLLTRMMLKCTVYHALCIQVDDGVIRCVNFEHRVTTEQSQYQSHTNSSQQQQQQQQGGGASASYHR